MGEGNIKHVSQRRLWWLSNLDFLVWSSIKIGWEVKTLWEVSTWTMANPWLDSAVCQLFVFFFLIMWSQIVLFCTILCFLIFIWMLTLEYRHLWWRFKLHMVWWCPSIYLFPDACVFATKRLRKRTQTFENIK